MVPDYGQKGVRIYNTGSWHCLFFVYILLLFENYTFGHGERTARVHNDRSFSYTIEFANRFSIKQARTRRNLELVFCAVMLVCVCKNDPRTRGREKKTDA